MNFDDTASTRPTVHACNDCAELFSSPIDLEDHQNNASHKGEIILVPSIITKMDDKIFVFFELGSGLPKL